MRRSSAYLAVAVLAVACCAGRAHADDKADVLAAAKAWGNALVDGDAKALRAGSIGAEPELARWEAMSKMFASFQKLTVEVTAKYGDKADASKLFQRPDFTSFGDETSVEVTGAEASLSSGEGKPPMKMQKAGGAWKVVLASLPAAAAKLDPKQIAPIAEAVSSTADEIKAGKYPTYADAMKALTQKMRAAAAKAK